MKELPKEQTVYCMNEERLEALMKQWVEDGDEIIEIDRENCIFKAKLNHRGIKNV
jgi:hypothetical protein